MPDNSPAKWFQVRFHAALLLCVGICLAPRLASATEVGDPRNLGVGFAVGEPTGIVAKLFIGPENAVDAGVSFFSPVSRCRVNGHWEGCGGTTSVALNADYLWQYVLVDGEAKLSWHFGAGARIWLFNSDSKTSDFAIEARMPLGVDLAFRKPAFLEVFLEFSPAIYILPGLGFDLEPALGVRFFF